MTHQPGAAEPDGSGFETTVSTYDPVSGMTPWQHCPLLLSVIWQGTLLSATTKALLQNGDFGTHSAVAQIMAGGCKRHHQGA